MQRFFAEAWQIGEDEIRITGQDVNHIRNVLRMRPGEAVQVSDGATREYSCVIREITPDTVFLTVLSVREPDLELPCRISLFQCLPKGDKMDLIVQKAVELGADAVIPVDSSRCIVKLDEKKAEKRRQRWQQIAEGAAKQSGRLRVPEIGPLLGFSEALSYAQSMDILLIPYELERGMERTREILKRVTPGKSVGIFIGPEGGFTKEEITLAEEAGVEPVTLGKRILRTETAGMALLSILMFQLEE